MHCKYCLFPFFFVLKFSNVLIIQRLETIARQGETLSSLLFKSQSIPYHSCFRPEFLPFPPYPPNRGWNCQYRLQAFPDHGELLQNYQSHVCLGATELNCHLLKLCFLL